MADLKFCLCGSGVPYGECCAGILANPLTARTAEALMRSRYTAYVIGDISYVLRTWHPSTRPSALEFDTILRWCKLEIIHTEKGLPDDNEGSVEFIAAAPSHGKMVKLHELSHFVKEAGQWLYLSGDILGDAPQERVAKIVGRNNLCPCGSGRKFKKCCGFGVS